MLRKRPTNAMSAVPKAKSIKVAAGVVIGCIIAGLPLLNKKVYQREQEVAQMRDVHYGGDLKGAARDSRLRQQATPADS